MSGNHRLTFHRAGSALQALGGAVRRLGRRKGGVAAVEFALILPMLLALYFGCVILAQGLDVGRKTQLLSRTLADITSQQLPAGTNGTGNCAATAYQAYPCLNDGDFIGGSNGMGILNAAAQVLFPFYTSTNTNMTISEIVFDNVSLTNPTCCEARVVWSVGSSATSTLRACSTSTTNPGPPSATYDTYLAPTTNGTNGAADMPLGVFPGGAGDVLASNAPYATSNTTDYYVIVADVSFSYKPVFGFQTNNWGQSPNGGAGYTITQTTYMTPRNGATTPVIWANGGTVTYSNDCTKNSSGVSNYGPSISTAQPGAYNIP